MKPTGKNVIYVDDDEDDREMLAESFAKITSHQFIAFSSGEELMNFLSLAKEDPCLIILDINMPMLTGWDIVKTLRADDNYKNIPIVLYTTGVSPHNKPLISKFKTNLVIKPISLAAMQSIAEKLIEFC